MAAATLWATLALVPVLLSSPRSRPVSRPPQDGALRALGRNLQAHTVNDCGGETEVKPDLSQRLRRFRREIVRLIGEELRAGSTTRASAETMERWINDRLDRAGVTEPERPEEPQVWDGTCPEVAVYGYVAPVRLQEPDGLPGVVIASVQLGVSCGSDSALYVFDDDPAGPHLRMALESSPYTSIDGAWGRFDFAVVRDTVGSDFAIVTTDVNPWCTSNWQRLTYRVWREGRDPWSPVLMASAGQTIYLGVDEPYTLKAEEQGFRIDFTGGFALDDAQLTRRHILRFRIGGARLTRLPPFADSPQEFVDEWLELPWDEARGLCAPEERDGLQLWHAKLAKEEHAQRSIFAIRDVAGGAGPSVEVLTEAEDPAPWVRFTVSSATGEFRMISARRATPVESDPETPDRDSSSCPARETTDEESARAAE